MKARKNSVNAKHQELQDSFKIFVGMFHLTKKSNSFYRNYKSLSEILFTPGQLIQYAQVKKNMNPYHLKYFSQNGRKEKKAIMDVVSFLGLKVSENSFANDLKALNKSRKENPLRYKFFFFALN